MDCSEGVHRPSGRYLFNWVGFSKHDILVERLLEANYKVISNPSDSTGVLCCLPVEFNNTEFEKVEVIRKDGTKEIIEVDTETAIQQLERYLKVQTYYNDTNTSNTIYYNKEDKEDIVDWLLEHWNQYIGVSFLPKNNPTVSAKDLGYSYLPQTYVSKKEFEEYISTLSEIEWEDTGSSEELTDDLLACSTGACPIR